MEDFEINNGVLIKYNGNDKNIVVPNGVKSIGEWAFYDCSSLTTIQLPNSVTSIGDYAFWGCSSLTTIQLPNSITSIGAYAFKGCSNLTSIQLPNSITSIGAYTFKGCSNLTSIQLPSGVTSIGDSAFSDCSSLTTITIPNSVTSIEDYTFRDCSSLTSIQLPNSVTSIGDYAFDGCSSLKSITIPNSVTSIGSSVFDGCDKLKYTEGNLIYIKTTDNNYFALYDTTSKDIESITINSNCKFILENAFSGCSSLTSIQLPSSVASIGDCTFNDCSSLNKVIVDDISSFAQINFGNTSSNPFSYANHLYLSSDIENEITEITAEDLNGCTEISSCAFSGCSSLTSIQLPNSVTSIGDSAFCNCSSLTSIQLPNSVTSICDGAFSHCSSLESIQLPSSVTSIGDWVFNDCIGLNKVIVDDISSFAQINYGYYSNPLYYAKHLYLSSDIENEITEITAEDLNGCTKISSYAFYYCSSLESIQLPNSVTSIGKGAFYGCSSLTSITIPDSVKSIANKVFSGCSSLESIIVDSNNKYYTSRDGNNNECNCIVEKATNTLIGSCKNTIIPNSVKSIGDNAFYDSSSLTSITIPDSVKSIGEDAFSNCNSLNKVIVDNISSFAQIKFKDMDSNPLYYAKHLYLSSNIENEITEITAGDLNGCTKISSYAFYDCNSLTSITIPDSVKSIGNRAFSGCGSLESIIVDSNNKYYTSRDGDNKECNCIIKKATNTLIVGCKNTIIPNSVKSIGEYAFKDCSSLTSIQLSSSMTSIGWGAFEYCKNLTSITFKGTKKQWKHISKGSWWNYFTGDYTIYCTDGNISK